MSPVRQIYARDNFVDWSETVRSDGRRELWWMMKMIN